jgi:GT2 family glycosyltransferase
MDLSIIIVPFKTPRDVEVTLDSIFASKVAFSYEVIIIDNGSTLESETRGLVKQKYLSDPDLAQKITYVANANEGFTGGNNRGMRMAKGEYMLLLNPDTKLEPDNLQTMMDFVRSRPDVGIATSKLIKGNGELDWACRRSEPNPWRSFARLFGLQTLFPKTFGSYNVMSKDIDEETEIDACAGAYMLFHRRIFDITGGFDEDFFMYGEDLDLCKRVRETGFKIWYYPKAVCYHYKGQTSRKSPAFALKAFHDAMWIYYKKHYKKTYGPLFSGLVYLGVKFQYGYKLFLNLFRKEKFVSK